MERAAEQLGGNTCRGDFQKAVELVRIDRDTVVHDRVDAGTADEELDEEGLRLHRIIRVVCLHALVVFRKDGVVDCKFGEHWVSHWFEANQSPLGPPANKVIPPSHAPPARLSVPASGSKPIQT